MPIAHLYNDRSLSATRAPRRSAGFLSGAAGALLFVSCALVVPQGRAATFLLTPRDLGGGMTLTGSVGTDGTIGVLAPGNIVTWNVVVTSVTDITYTPANVANISSGVTSDGSALLVPSSPDGTLDGGALAFRSPNPFSDLGLQVADFTGAAVNGGVSAYSTAFAFDSVSLGVPNATNYTAALLRAGTSSVFDLVPVNFGPDVRLTGSIQTDGAVGNAVITDWNLLVRETTRWRFTPLNSSLVGLTNVTADNLHLRVLPFDSTGEPGIFAFGFGSFLDPTVVTVADFTFNPDGETGISSPFVQQVVSPLPLEPDGTVIVATVPDSLPAAAVVLAVLATTVVARLRQKSAGCLRGR